MKLHLFLLAALVVIHPFHLACAQEARAESSQTAQPKAKRNTYPLYARVVAITPQTLSVARSDKPDAKVVDFTINAGTQYVNGDQAVTIHSVRVGAWIGGSVKKAEGGGPDTLMKVNIGVKQKVAKTSSE
jgi:hypothetical protein